MRKIMNIILLVGWGMNLGLGILNLVTGGSINPIVYICACLICIMHYAGELLWGRDE